MHKVTIGIPIYNGGNLLECSLLSALNQTYPYIEYLFIDDKGDSMDIVHRIVAEHERAESVRIIDQRYIVVQVLLEMQLSKMQRVIIYLRWIVMT